MAGSRDTIRIAAVGDIHVKRTPMAAAQALFTAMTEAADIALLCGDLTDYGTDEEAEMFAEAVRSTLRIPALAVLGNHDYESGQPERVSKIFESAGIFMLDRGSPYEIHGVGFGGAKGFVGGFGRRQLGSWGEQSLKDLVHETIEESLKLEQSLAKLRTQHKIAVLHYSPIQATLEGEPPEIAPFLGSSRLEEPLERYRVTAAFHGHAHHGVPEGTTHGGIPVYNVAMAVMRRAYPDRPPFRVLELPVGVESPV